MFNFKSNKKTKRISISTHVQDRAYIYKDLEVGEDNKNIRDRSSRVSKERGVRESEAKVRSR